MSGKVRCDFCGKELPEDDGMILYAKGRLHDVDPEMPPYPVCMTCLKSHKLKLTKLEKVKR